MDKAFLHPVPAVLKHFEVDQAQGLSEEQIERQREKYGRNGEFDGLPRARSVEEASEPRR